MTIADKPKTTLRRRTLFAAAIAGLALAGAAAAYAHADPVDLKVVDRETGQPLKVWRQAGRLFVAGQPGARYGLRVTNHTGRRVLVVLSVDGVNILSGETAGYDQRGYVFGPYETYDLNGWRKSDSEIAAFAFAPLPQSYAARTGRPGEVGVIGMAVFKEKLAPPPPPPPQPEASMDQPAWREEAPRDASRAAGASGLARAMPAPAAPSSMTADKSEADGPIVAQRRSEKLGTAHGAREWSVVATTAFERATAYPQSVRQIEYDTYANLVAAGVIPRWRQEPRHPRPFPTNPDGAGYVPDPPAE